MKPCGRDVPSPLEERSHPHVRGNHEFWRLVVLLWVQGRYSGVCARRIDVVRGGAPKFEIDVGCLLYTSQLVSNVVNLDFSFRMRILSPSNSSGVLRYESETVLVLFQEPRFKSFLRPFQKAQFEVHLTAPVWVSSLSAGNPIPPNPPIKV